jgi:hypothetical protein
MLFLSEMPACKPNEEIFSRALVFYIIYDSNESIGELRLFMQKK